MNNLDRRIQQAVSHARKFIGFTKLEHLVHADSSGGDSLDLLKRLTAVELELKKMAAQPGNADLARQASALGDAVATTQDVIRLAWRHHHGMPLPNQASAAATPRGRMTKVVA